MRLKKSFINLINKLPSVFLLLVIFSTNVVSPIYAFADDVLPEKKGVQVEESVESEIEETQPTLESVTAKGEMSTAGITERGFLDPLSLWRPSKPTLISPIGGVVINDDTPFMDWTDSKLGILRLGLGKIEKYNYEYRYGCTGTTFKDCKEIYKTTTKISEYQAGYTADGRGFWRVQAVDDLGIKSEWSDYEEFTVDTTAPTATVEYLPLTPTNDKVDAIVTFSEPIREKPTLESGYDGGTIPTFVKCNTAMTECTFSHWGNRDYVIAFYDLAGNKGTANISFKNIDNTAPVLKVDTIIDGYSNTANPQIHATDANPFQIFVKRDGVLVRTAVAKEKTDGTYSSWFGIGYMVDGSYEVEAVDEAGNTSGIISFVLDRIAPIVEITSPIDGAYVRGKVDFRGTVTDTNLLRYYYNIKGVTSKTVTQDENLNDQTIYEWDTTKSADGEYEMRLEARDKADNKDKDSIHIIKVIVDNTKPTGEVLGIRYGTVDVKNFITNETSPQLYGTYSDNNMEVEKVEVYIGEIEATVRYSLGNWTAKFTNLLDGIHEVTLKITDKAGNTFEITENITVDSVPPRAVYTHYIDGEKYTEEEIATVKYLSQLSFTAEYTDEEPSSGLAYDSFVIFQAQEDHSFKFSQNGAKAYCSWRKDPNRLVLTGTIFSQIEKVPFTRCVENLPDGEYYMAHQVYDNAVRKDNTTITQFRDVLGLHFSIKNTPEITITPSSKEVFVDSEPFDITASAIDGNGLRTITWTGSDSFTATGDRITFTPTTVGTFTYTATVTDEDDDFDEKSITITVNAIPEQTEETPETTPEEGGEVAGATDTNIPEPNTSPKKTTPAIAQKTAVIETTAEVVEIDEEEKEVLGEEDEKACNADKKISGHIFIDKNNNNQQDDGEKGIKDVKVQIYVMEDGRKEIIETITTDEEGYFEITNICTGKYNILIEEETLPKGYAVKGEADREIVVTEEDTDTTEGAYLGVSVEDSRSSIQKYWYWLLLIIPVVGYILYKKKNEDN